MVLLKQGRIKEQVDEAGKIVAADLVKYKGNFTLPSKSGGNMFSEGLSFEILSNQTIGRRFTVDELYAKIKTAFKSVDLEKMHFEFAVEIMNPSTVEKQSGHFLEEYLDTANNFSRSYPLSPTSGSQGENIVIDEVLTIVGVDWESYAVQSLRWRFATAILFSIIIIAAFYLTVRTMLRQKKLGEIKNDFINNMTHEFKTPIATISLAVDAMRNEKVLQDREKLSYFSTIIKEENKRMNRQVETILKASQLEKQEVDLNLKPVHVHEVIKDVVENFALQLEEKQGKAELLLNATNDLVDADEVHMSNLVNNLFDNALKYSKENTPPFVKLTTQSNGKKFIIRIEDNGIGMNRETLKRIFERFYRAHTGNLHNVKGFGLGLSYVKTMVEAHHGEIKADSTLGKGSSFIIELPLKKN
jgi:two-component system, OmpR family, phosphate regulon sensor histidine kinase PhoR